MIDSINQQIKMLQIFFMKDLDYVMNIIKNWITLDELEGTKTRRDFI